jgi:hypothetical protein
MDYMWSKGATSKFRLGLASIGLTLTSSSPLNLPCLSSNPLLNWWQTPRVLQSQSALCQPFKPDLPCESQETNRCLDCLVGHITSGHYHYKAQIELMFGGQAIFCVTCLLATLNNTPSIHKRMELSLFEESNDLKFDQSYIKNVLTFMIQNKYH